MRAAGLRISAGRYQRCGATRCRGLYEWHPHVEDIRPCGSFDQRWPWQADHSSPWCDLAYAPTLIACLSMTSDTQER